MLVQYKAEWSVRPETQTQKLRWMHLRNIPHICGWISWITIRDHEEYLAESEGKPVSHIIKQKSTWVGNPWNVGIVKLFTVVRCLLSLTWTECSTSSPTQNSSRFTSCKREVDYWNALLTRENGVEHQLSGPWVIGCLYKYIKAVCFYWFCSTFLSISMTRTHKNALFVTNRARTPCFPTGYVVRKVEYKKIVTMRYELMSTFCQNRRGEVSTCWRMGFVQRSIPWTLNPVQPHACFCGGNMRAVVSALHSKSLFTGPVRPGVKHSIISEMED